MDSTIADHMTEEALVHSRNPTFESSPIMSHHHCFANEYQITQDTHDMELDTVEYAEPVYDMELDTVEYADPMYMDVPMEEGNTNYKQ